MLLGRTDSVNQSRIIIESRHEADLRGAITAFARQMLTWKDDQERFIKAMMDVYQKSLYAPEGEAIILNLRHFSSGSTMCPPGEACHPNPFDYTHPQQGLTMCPPFAFPRVTELDLSWNRELKTLPTHLAELFPNLKILNIANTAVRQLPLLPETLEQLIVCYSCLEALPQQSLPELFHVNAMECRQLRAPTILPTVMNYFPKLEVEYFYAKSSSLPFAPSLPNF